MENVQSFDDTDVEDMYEILKPLVRAKEGLQVKILIGVALSMYKFVLVCKCVLTSCHVAQPSGIPRSTQQNGHGASSFTNGHCKNPRRTNVGSQVC